MTANIIVSDGVEWLIKNEQQPSFITSPPQWNETGQTYEQWLEWYKKTVRLIIDKTELNGYTIFYQTDRKYKGEWVSLCTHILEAAHQAGAKVIWHKIVLRRKPNTIDLFRPGYTHLICISKQGSSTRATPDVFERGEMYYPNSMGIEACKRSMEFLKAKGIKKVVDPFCGRGSVIVQAVKEGLNSFGIDFDAEQVVKAKEFVKKETGYII